MNKIEIKSGIEKKGSQKLTIQKDSETDESEFVEKELTRPLIILVSIFSFLSLGLFVVITIINNSFNKSLVGNITRIVIVGLLWIICMPFLFYFFVKYLFKIRKSKQERELKLNRKLGISFLWIIAIFVAFVSGFILLSLFGF